MIENHIKAMLVTTVTMGNFVVAVSDWVEMREERPKKKLEIK
jgi:hypothetical protein